MDLTTIRGLLLLTDHETLRVVDSDDQLGSVYPREDNSVNTIQIDNVDDECNYLVLWWFTDLANARHDAALVGLLHQHKPQFIPQRESVELQVGDISDHQRSDRRLQGHRARLLARPQWHHRGPPWPVSSFLDQTHPYVFLDTLAQVDASIPRIKVYVEFIDHSPHCSSTLTTKASFEECLIAIRENAFTTSDYPVIITIEDHLDADLQTQAAIVSFKSRLHLLVAHDHDDHHHHN
jgi:hypothetical protein